MVAQPVNIAMGIKAARTLARWKNAQGCDIRWGHIRSNKLVPPAYRYSIGPYHG